MACVGKKMDLHRTRKQSRTTMKSSTSSSSSSSSGSSGASGKHHLYRAKQLPVIKVVHIFNPTVIKTDAANFRSLVQELTGRSCSGQAKSHHHQKNSNSKKINTDITIAHRNSIYNDQFKQLQTTAKEFMSPNLFGYLSADDNCHHQYEPLTAIGTTTKRSTMYIPERLGTFTDVDIISGLVSSEGDSQHLVDYNDLLPGFSSLNTIDEAAIPRFRGFYGSF